jgi:hypothetical protein
MNFSTLIGSAGVSLLLLAFCLNLFRGISREGRLYLGMNILGAGLSCYASFLIRFLPFIILEAAWCLAALAAFVKKPSGT